MSLVLGALLAGSVATSAPTLPQCSWDRPGVNPFIGSVVAAVDRYADIPAPVRAKLKARMSARQYDEMATIRRDTIEGKYGYSDLRDMHFGQGQICRSVSRQRWSDASVERGLVYCESGHCLIVPTVCRNVSRITRSDKPLVAAASTEEQGGGGGGGSSSQAAALPDGELSFEAPAAGQAPATFAGGSDRALPGPVSGPVSSAGLTLPNGGGGGGAGPSYAAGPSFGGINGGGASGGHGDGDETGSRTRELAGIVYGPKPAPPIGPQETLGPPAPTTPVPEPSTWMLFGLGLLLTTLLKRQRRD
jgi:hypothetical protein